MKGHIQSQDAVPSPVATGGGGERFEQRVDAYALALLLTRSRAPVLLDAVVVEVRLQTRHLGWRTDDLLMVGEVRPGVTRKLAIQAKRTFTIAEKDEDCVETICGMWDDFVAGDRFNPAADRLAVATLHGTAPLLRDFTSLLDCARAAPSAGDFRRRLDLEGYVSQKAKRQNDALLAILRVHVPGALDDDRYWQFLRVLTVLSLDLGTATAHSEANVLTLLAHVASDVADPVATASATWAKLLDLASEGRQAAASWRREALPAELLERHRAVPAADDRARLDLVAHGQSVRSNIHTTIARGYTLDRAALANALLDAVQEVPVVVVAGAAGSGKSALAKMLLDRVETERPVLAFQAVEFATAHINETLAKTQTALNARSLLALLAAHDRTTVLVDGVERLLEHSVRDAFTQLLTTVAEAKSLRLLLTCRDYSLGTVRSALLEPLGLGHRVVEVGALSDDELDAVVEEVPALAPALGDPQMRAFLRTPYLLDMASRLDWAGTTLPENVRAFRHKCWRELVRDEAHPGGGMPARREAAFVDVARQRAAELRPHVRPKSQDTEALDALREASLLELSPESDKLYAPAHDVLEDWAILKWLDDVAQTTNDLAAALANAVGGLPAMRRGFRRWLAERLDVDPVPARNLVLAVSGRTDVPQHFRDDCMVAALLSDAASPFLDGCRERIEVGDSALLRQVLHLLRVACKRPPPWLPEGSLPSSMLVPTGPAWAPALELVANCIPAAPDGDTFLILGLVEDWVRQVNISLPTPPGADAAGRIASALLPLFEGYAFDDPRKRAMQVVLTIPRHAPAFEVLAQRAKAGDRGDRYAREFADLAVATLSSAFACRDYPQVVIDILRATLIVRETDRVPYDSSPLGVDRCFGIHERGPSDFFPASAIQGPFRALFLYHPRQALAFVIELLNHAGDWYGLRRWAGNDLEPAERITLDIPDTGPVEQWMNWRLYALHRGMTVGPYSLQSALMALDTWLLQVAATANVDLDGLLLHILRESNNVMATAIVASVCIAYPRRAGRAALALLSSRALIQGDRQRMAAEPSTSVEIFAGLDPSHRLFEAERRTANALAHRREDLEMLALRLQLTDFRDAVWKLIDRHRATLHDTQDESTLVWRLALHRMDMRGFRPVEEQPVAESAKPAEGQGIYYGPGNLEPEVQDLVDTSRERMSILNRHLELKQTARAAWTNRGGPEAADWRKLLTDAQSLAAENATMESYARGGPGIAAAVCIRDRLGELSSAELAWCVARVAREIACDDEEGGEMYEHARMFGADRAAAAVLPLLVAEAPSQLPGDPIDFLACAFTHRVDEVVDYAYAGAGAFLGKEHDDLILRCAAAAVREAEVRERARAEERKRGRVGIVPQSDVATRVTKAVRGALAGSVAEAREALVKLRFDTWEGRKAARRVSTLLEGRADSMDSRSFVQRSAQWLAETWGRDRQDRGSGDRDYHGEYDLSGRIAKVVLKLPEGAAREVCAPLIALATSEPHEVAKFVEDLIVAADGGGNDSFWALWQAFADQAAEAAWMERLDREHPYEPLLIDRLFLTASWKEDATHWPRLEGNAQRVHALARRLPAVAACVHAYTRFLYTIGRQELPHAFIVVDSVLRRGDGARIVSKSEIAFYLESMLGQFVYAQPFRLKRDVALRDAVLHLLDALVSAGSSAAYRMRDDFVTPLRAESADGC